MQSYKSYYMVSPQTVFTYPFHHAKLQILLHGVTANSLYLSFSPCKATNLTTWCHCKQSLLILFTMQSYKSYHMVSPQTVFTYPFHHAKLQILPHGVTANSLYLSFSPCKATSLTHIKTKHIIAVKTHIDFLVLNYKIPVVRRQAQQRVLYVKQPTRVTLQNDVTCVEVTVRDSLLVQKLQPLITERNGEGATLRGGGGISSWSTGHGTRVPVLD